MKVRVEPWDEIVYLGGSTDDILSAMDILDSSELRWVFFENKDLVIAILRLNGFEVEDRT